MDNYSLLSLERKELKASSKIDAAIVFLLGSQEDDIKDWMNCLASLEKYAVPVMSIYPIIVFHEVSLTSKLPMLTKDVSNSPFIVQFVQITLKSPPHIPLDAPCPYSKRSRWGYCDMIQFFAFDIFTAPVVKNLKYYWRLDSDSLLLAPLKEDLFGVMQEGNFLYGYKEERLDYLHVTQGLWRMALDYYKTNAIKSQWNGLERVFPSNVSTIDTTKVPMYYNNFEIVDIPQYSLLPGLEKWTRAVNESCGIYLYRWGDAPLRWLTIQFLASPLSVFFIPDTLVQYKHGLV